MISRHLGQAGGKKFECTAAVAGTHHPEATVDGDAKLIFLGGHEPGRGGVARMTRHSKAEAGWRALQLLPIGRIIGGVKNAVVMLYPIVTGRAPALHHPVRVLSAGVVCENRRYEGGTQAAAAHDP